MREYGSNNTIQYNTTQYNTIQHNTISCIDIINELVERHGRLGHESPNNINSNSNSSSNSNV